MTSKNYRASLLKNLGITTLLPARKKMLQNLSLRDETLTYTDKGQELICRANIFMRNQHKKMSTLFPNYIRCFYQKPEIPTTAKNLQNQKLYNNAFLDANMRVVNQNDFAMPNVILTRSNGRILVHCTKNMDILLNKIKKACLINSPIEIHNITDFELQGENTSTKSWNDKLDNVLNSETCQT